MEEQLLHQATYDLLTDLPNRALLQDRANQAIVFAQRENRLMALLFLDLDRFKLINDSLGHKMGDLLLCAVAKRLAKSVRNSDTVARLGGDEFVIILSSVKNYEDIVRVSNIVLVELRKPFFIEERELNVTASLGISTFPKDASDTDTLIRNADTCNVSCQRYRSR